MKNNIAHNINIKKYAKYLNIPPKWGILTFNWLENPQNWSSFAGSNPTLLFS